MSDSVERPRFAPYGTPSKRSNSNVNHHRFRGDRNFSNVFGSQPTTTAGLPGMDTEFVPQSQAPNYNSYAKNRHYTSHHSNPTPPFAVPPKYNAKLDRNSDLFNWSEYIHLKLRYIPATVDPTMSENQISRGLLYRSSVVDQVPGIPLIGELRFTV